MDKQKIGKVFRWLPRILVVLFLIFLAIFSLDVFNSGLNFSQIVVGLFMHNIPALLLLGALLLAWKKEWLGGVLFIIFGVVIFFGLGFKEYEGLLFIVAPSTLIGILFLISSFLNKN
jgi:hypothetical protein